MKELRTWSGANAFRYEGSVSTGITIHCGDGFSRTYRISHDAILDTLGRFSGKTTPVGCHRTAPPEGSIGDWLRVHHKRGGIMSYLGSILVQEGFARRTPEGLISIARFRFD